MWSVLIATSTPACRQVPQADEVREALATEGVRQRVGVLVVPGGLRVDEHAEARGARRRLGVDEIGVNQRVAPVGRGLRAFCAASIASSTTSTPASPVTCATICQPRRWPMAMAEAICSRRERQEPR